ncbi:MAG: hypothetical protein ABFS39_00055 [Pseudomonadota bacterium]
MKRWKRRKLPAAICLAAMPMLLTTPTAWAVDAYRPMFTNFYAAIPGLIGSKLDSCLTCHPTTNGGARNSYGADFEAAKGASTLEADVQAALAAIEPLDSDGDTFINIDEIAALSFPGDCTDPDPAGCGPGGGEPPVIPPGTITEGPTLLGCYEWSRFPNERLALSIKRYGGLVTTNPRNDFMENQIQTSHGVHGKHVGPCGTNTVGAVDGSFIKDKGIGSHLSLHTSSVRGDGYLGGEDWCRSIVVDCISEEDVQVPREFKCRSRNEFDIFHGESELKLVMDPAADPLCGAFEDLDGPVADGRGHASGLNLGNGGGKDND